MKQTLNLRAKIAFMLVIAALCTLAPAFAAGEGIDKVAPVGVSVGLTKADIKASVGSLSGMSGIRITTLPDAEAGTLRYDGKPVSAGTEIALNQLDKLKFLPSSYAESSAQFTFLPVMKNGISDKSVSVGVTTVQGANRAPEVTNIKLETFVGMPLMGHLNAYDPDGDRLVYRVSEYPDKGDLEVDEKSGIFVFYPFDISTGSDSFKWYAFDENGNISKKATVKISIKKVGNNLTFADMIESAIHFKTISLVKDGIMSAVKSGEEYLFSPAKEVSRAEFIVSAVKAVGGRVDLKASAQTPFADDGDIRAEDKPYILYTIQNGIISGYPNGTLANVLKPDQPISAFEAAVIMDKLLKLSDSVPTAAVSSSLVPAWARQSVTNLKLNHILPDTDTDYVTRETAAEILFESIRYEKENTSGLLFWAK